MTREEESLLSRWSRLKRSKPDVSQETKRPEPVAADVPAIETGETDESEADLLARLDLPVPETLGPGDDFSRFMTDGIPTFLRQRALRVLWRSNPDLAVLDGLIDYGEDFRASSLSEAVSTAYQVGRGFLKEPEEEPADASAPNPEDSHPETVAEHEKEEIIAQDPSRAMTDTAYRADPPGAIPETDSAPSAENTHDRSNTSAAEANALPTPRRMVFTEES